MSVVCVDNTSVNSMLRALSTARPSPALTSSLARLRVGLPRACMIDKTTRLQLGLVRRELALALLPGDPRAHPGALLIDERAHAVALVGLPPALVVRVVLVVLHDELLAPSGAHAARRVALAVLPRATVDLAQGRAGRALVVPLAVAVRAVVVAFVASDLPVVLRGGGRCGRGAVSVLSSAANELAGVLAQVEATYAKRVARSRRNVLGAEAKHKRRRKGKTAHRSHHLTVAKHVEADKDPDPNLLSY